MSTKKEEQEKADQPVAKKKEPTTPKKAIQPNQPVTDEPVRKPATYLVNARYELPRFGGIPYPQNLNLYGFVTFEIKEKAAGKGINKKTVLTAASNRVKKIGHEPKGLVIEGFSKLPEGW